MDPGSPAILYSQAVSYYFLAQYDSVRQSLDEEREHAPASARELFLYAMSYENEGNSSEAIKYLRQAVALEPANARFHCHLGVALLQKDQTEQAQQAFAEAIRLKPGFALPSYELGKVLAREKKADAAARQLETATRLQPDLALHFTSSVGFMERSARSGKPPIRWRNFWLSRRGNRRNRRNWRPMRASNCSPRDIHF